MNSLNKIMWGKTGYSVFKTSHQTWKPQDQTAVQQLSGLRVSDAAEAGDPSSGETSGQTADSVC